MSTYIGSHTPTPEQLLPKKDTHKLDRGTYVFFALVMVLAVLVFIVFPIVAVVLYFITASHKKNEPNVSNVKTIHTVDGKPVEDDGNDKKINIINKSIDPDNRTHTFTTSANITEESSSSTT